MKIGKAALAAITLIVLFAALVLYSVSLLPFSPPEWLTLKFLIEIGAIVAPLLTVLWAIYNSRPRLNVEVVRCAHRVQHSRVERKPTGTELRFTLRVKNGGEKTSIYRSRIECKSDKYPYKKEDRETKVFVVEKGDTIPYYHRFFIRGYEILDIQIKVVLWLYHTYGKKKIDIKSFREVK